jgi:serine/threonine protein phosphatase PrpC
VSTGTAAWQVLARTAKAGRKNVNQDRHGWTVFPDGTGIALAVADGHGSAAHPRSDTGAQLAVDVFLHAVDEFRAGLEPDLPLKQIKIRAEDHLPRNLVREWRQRTEDDLAQNPLAESENNLAATPILYGTTLIGAMITAKLVLGWQIGDGDLCLITREGQADTPLRNLFNTLGDETDSLCSDDAPRLVRTYWGPIPAIDAPALIALSTDGLSKSFVSFDGYLEFIIGVYQRVIHGSEGKVSDDLQDWLEQASSFSGDDATLIVAWQRPPPASPGPEGQPR